MEFGLSAEQILLQDTVRKFAEQQVGLDVVRRIAAGESSDAGIWQGLSELGVPALLVPEEQGGVGLSILDAAIVAEVLGYQVAPTPFISTGVMAVQVLSAAGDPVALLGQMAAGTYRMGIAFGEAIGARNEAGVVASKELLTGKALFVLDAEADGYLLATADKAIYHVAADAPGLRRRPLTTIDRTRSTCELVLEQTPAVLVSSDATVFERALDAGRVVQAADTLGAAQSALDQAVAYAGQRQQFNRVIGSFQAVKHMCAEMAARLEPCRSLIWYAAHAQDHMPEEARVTACHAKAHLSEVGQFVAKTATEVHGGMGFTDLVGLHYWFKRIGANRQLLGSPTLVREEAARLQGMVS